MMQQHRTKLLLAALVLVVLIVSSDRITSIVQGPLNSRRDTGKKLAERIEAEKKNLAKVKRDARDLEYWEQRSLPSDPAAARSAYQLWLFNQLTRLELTNPNVTVGDAVPRGSLYSTIAASLQARGTLEQWTRFLYEFYHAGHLHQIRSISINPTARKDVFDMSLAIEALVLPNADRDTELTKETSDRLAYDSFDDYRLIAQRNLFGSGGITDPTDQTFLTAINQVNGEPEAWFTQRSEVNPDRAVLKLRRGQSLKIGQFTGKVVGIEGDDVVLESDGQRWLIALGESIAQAFALPPGL